MSIGLAVIGAGKIGRHRARLAQQHAGVAFLGIADIDEEAARSLAEEVGADTWTTDVASLVGSTDVDAVIISTQEMAHTEPLLQTLPFGKPTLVEKPLTLDLAEADQVIDVASEHGQLVGADFLALAAEDHALDVGQLVG